MPKSSPPPETLRQRKRRPFRRLHSATKACASDVYSLQEVMKLYDVDEQTVRNWRKSGLECVDVNGRFLVRGDKLNAFHADRNARAKQPLTLNEFLCLSCHLPREPAPGSVVGASIHNPSLRLEARCSVCGTQLYRPWSTKASAALLSRQDLWPESSSMSSSVAAEQPSNRLDPPPDLRQLATTCDSVGPPKASHSRKLTRTTERRLQTQESSQLSLPFRS
jgi:hypothetical protein